MVRVVVAGVTNVRLAHAVESFPVPLTSNRHSPSGLSVRVAGSGWTAATVLAALGADLTFATYVGADGPGLLVAQRLRDRGWYGPAIQVCAEQPRSLVLYDRAGTRSAITDLRSTWDLRYPADLFGALLDERGCDVALLGSVGFTRPLIEVTAERGIPIATDLQLISNVAYPRKQDWLRAATVVACSHERLPHGPEAWIEALWRRFGTPVALVGCGAGGAVVGVGADRSMWRVASVVPRGVRFVGGAGDVLLAAFVHRYAETGDPVLAARAAVVAAGWQVGGGPDDEFDLSLDELRDVVGTHGLPAVRRVR